MEYVEKELCLTRCDARSVRSGLMRDALNGKKYLAVLHNRLYVEDEKILETERKNPWRCCVIKCRL